MLMKRAGIWQLSYCINIGNVRAENMFQVE